MTKLHILHDWRVIAEKNIRLPTVWRDHKYILNSDYKTVYACSSKTVNIQILRCWKCDKIKHKILDAKGQNHTKELDLWVAKELVGMGPENDNKIASIS